MNMKDIEAFNAERFWHPMAHPAEMRKNKPIIVSKGEGVEIEDIHGHKTLDAVGGLWCVNLGYSNQAVKDAISRQLDTLPFYNCFRGTTNPAAIELSVMLTDFFAPDGMTRTFYTSGGSDSVEVALRLARQFHKINGQPERTKFLSMRSGYHGTHFGGSSIGGIPRFQRQYGPMLPGCYHIPCPLSYRNPWDETDPERLAALCAGALEHEIQFQSPDTVAAFIMEPVIGSGGIVVPHPTFMARVRELCDRHGALLIADEVITGFGRTGAWSGSRLWGVKPDLMTLAKGITNGFIPFGAVMINQRIADAFEADESQAGTLSTGYTYSGHPVGAAAAIAALRENQRLNLPENALGRGNEMLSGFAALQNKHECIGDVRGQGLMLGIELVKDRESKAPLDSASVLKVFRATYEAGAMIRVSGNMIIISPPLILTSRDGNIIVDCVDRGLQAL